MQLRKLSLVFALMLGLSLLLLAGCGAEDQLTNLQDEFAGEEGASLTIPELTEIDEIAGETSAPQDTTSVLLYFADPENQGLVAEAREISKVEGIARATMNELVKGPSAESVLLPTIPLGTQLVDINVKPDGLAIVDFSSELVDNHWGGATGENLTVYSIVNTLSQFPTVDRVELRVEGQNIETIAGHVDVSGELFPDTTLVMAPAQ